MGLHYHMDTLFLCQQVMHTDVCLSLSHNDFLLQAVVSVGSLAIITQSSVFTEA